MPGSTITFWEITRLIVTGTVLSLLLFAAIITLLVFLIRPHARKYKPSDFKVFDLLLPLVSHRKNRFMLFITWLGTHKFLIPANLILILFFPFYKDLGWVSIRVAAIALSSLGLMLVLKYLFRRKRPLAPLLKAVKGLSFPSGHAIMSVTFYGMIIYIIGQLVKNETLKIILIGLLVILILLIGYSRVYLRVHYASDVLAGFIIGLLWLFISLTLIKAIETYYREQPGPDTINISATKLNNKELVVVWHDIFIDIPGTYSSPLNNYLWHQDY